MLAVPFANSNNFSNTAMAQEYDYDDYGEYNSDPNYNIDEHTVVIMMK